MEAVPRLPMLSFDMLVCTKKISFTHKIEKYISAYYHENPSSYHSEIQTLDGLRNAAVWPSDDINSCQSMKKYYCQLHYMKSRFPMDENQPVALQFSWKDAFTKMSCTVPDVGFEEMCVLFNIGALHSKLGTAEGRSTLDGMKMACTHFQCAAWAFQVVREQYAQYVGLVIANIDIVRAMELLCLAQAQECILEKSLLDNRKAAVVVKVAAELSNFYFKAHKLLVAGDDTMLYEHLPQNKYTLCYVQFKIAHYRSISLLYAGQQAEEQQQMGARVAYYQTALDALEEARCCVGRMASKTQQLALFSDTLAFTWDVMEGKRKAAVNENEFIYHEEVPQVTGPGLELKGASLVKGIPFSVTDMEVSGPDIFARLIPMVAHEASSIYSEQKASLLRYIAEEIEKNDNQLQEFMSAINVDFLTEIKSTTGLTQELVDRAADISARPEIGKELVEMMSKLSDAYHEIESLLSEIHKVIKNEEQAEAKYQSIMGNRPQSIVLTELHREASKYQEAHNRASESNDALHKAMTTHVANLKLLAQPLGKLQEEIPSIVLPDSNIDEYAIQKLETVLAKVEEMKTQRSMLWTQFREEIHKDDITPLLVTTKRDMDDVFETEMGKHKNKADLIKQNIVAQENIKAALTNSYAALNDSRKYIEKVLQRRNAVITALISSYDTYDDLKTKALKGIEFYSKLENNVTKLYQRVRSTCKVQQEEREQLLISSGALIKTGDSMSYASDNIPIENNEDSLRKGPKLKDYLDTRRTSRSANEANNSYPSYHINRNRFITYPPGARPAPIGEDSVTSSVSNNETALLSTTGDTLNQDITSRMAQLKITQQCWQDSGVYDPNNALSSRLNTPGNVVNELHDLSNKKASSSVQHYNSPSTPILANNTYAIPSFVPTSEAISDSSRYSYNTAYGLNTAGSTMSSSANSPFLLHSKQINATPLNNTEQKPIVDTYNLYRTDYPQQEMKNVNKDSSSGYFNNSVAGGNVGNTIGYTYAGYNNQQSNVSSTAIPSYANLNNRAMHHGIQFNMTSAQQTNNSLASGSNYPNGIQSTNQEQFMSYGNIGNYSTAANQTQSTDVTTYANLNSSAVHYGIPYNNTTVQQTNYPVASCSNYLNAIQSTNQEKNISYDNINTYSGTVNQTQSTNIRPALVTPNQQFQYIPTFTYHADNLRLPSSPASPIAINASVMSSQSIGSGYINMCLDNRDIAPIKSHATSHFNADPIDYYGQQASSNYCRTYTAQPTLEYNFPNIEQKQNESTLMNKDILTQQQEKDHGVSSNNKVLLQPDVQNINNIRGIDLLAGLDFSLPQTPLVPQKELPPTESIAISQNSAQQPMNSISNTKETNNVVIYYKKPADKPIKKEPFRSATIVTKFTTIAKEFCIVVDSLVIDKTLNALWKEIQDTQDSVNINSKSISVARCYPLKNRFPDILPYDYNRIELLEAKDDYINASKIYDLHEYVPNFIVTQTPLKTTLVDFWDMVWERDVQTIVCLLSDSEIGIEIYWPTLQNNVLNIGNKVITLQNAHVRPYSSEWKIQIHIPEKRESKCISLYQFTSWTGSVIPTNVAAFLAFVHDIYAEYDAQKSHLNPILVHCNSGVGRSGCFCTVLSVMGEVHSTGQCADVKKTISLISAMRKNILKDREHLKFTYNTIAQFYKDLIKVHNSAAIEITDPIVNEEPAAQTVKEDPLNSLDPLWATKK